MLIEVFTDYTCPFCYIGKQRLKIALGKVKLKQDVELQSFSYEIHPQIENEKKQKYIDYLIKTKNQTEEQVNSLVSELTEHAAEVGLSYNFDEMIVANTSDAHRLSKWIAREGYEEQYSETLMRGYFTEGKDLADHNYLAQVVESLGLSKERAFEILTSEEYQQQIDIDRYNAQQLGVESAPFFVFNNQFGIRGVEPEEVFIRTIKQASGEY